MKSKSFSIDNAQFELLRKTFPSWNLRKHEDILYKVVGPIVAEFPYYLRKELWEERGSHSFWYNSNEEFVTSDEESRKLGMMFDPDFSETAFNKARLFAYEIQKAKNRCEETIKDSLKVKEITLALLKKEWDEL